VPALSAAQAPIAMRYRYQDLAFDAPDGLTDQSMIVLVDGERAALTLAREPLDRSLGAYVDAVIEELTASMSGYRLEARAGRLVAGRDAVVVAQCAILSDGRPVRQQQAFVDAGAQVLVVTVTSPLEVGAAGHALLERVLASLELP